MGAIESGGQTGEVELLALRAVAPRRAARRAARGAWVEGASLTTAEPPALRGLVLSQRDKTHHRVARHFQSHSLFMVMVSRILATWLHASTLGSTMAKVVPRLGWV